MSSNLVSEYAHPWEQRKLGDITDSFSGGTPKVGNEEYYGGEIPFIRSAEINSSTTELYITKKGLDNSSAKMVSKGTILYALYGATSGECGISQIDGAINQAILAIKPKCGYVPYFISTWLRRSKFSIVSTFLQGGQGNLSGEIVKNLSLMLPCQNEQKKIGELFKKLDSTITLHQRQCETLKKQKQFFLQNMFPKEGESSPKIRFKGFSDSWKQCKLHEICSMNARIGWQNLRTSEFLDSGDYLLITGTDFVNGKVNFKSCHYVDKYRFDQDLKIQVQNGSILITKDGTLGKVAIIESLPKPATLNAGVFNVVIKSKDIDNYYLYQYLKAPFLMNYVNKRSTGGTIKHLNQSILVDFPVLKPSLQEQQKIGAYFERLDNLITLHQR